MNAMLSHTEGLLKAALTCLQDVPSSRDLKPKEFEEGISSFLHELSSFLVVVPGHPELGAFYILRGLLNLIESQSRLISGRRKVRLLCGILCLLCAIGQEQLPFHVGNQQVISFPFFSVVTSSLQLRLLVLAFSLHFGSTEQSFYS
jgi:hypothetical protein